MRALAKRHAKQASMSKKQRRQFSAEQKLAIVKRNLVDKISVSDLCDKHQILAAQFYQWRKQLLDEGATRLLSDPFISARR